MRFDCVVIIHPSIKILLLHMTSTILPRCHDWRLMIVRHVFWIRPTTCGIRLDHNTLLCSEGHTRGSFQRLHALPAWLSINMCSLFFPSFILRANIRLGTRWGFLKVKLDSKCNQRFHIHASRRDGPAVLPHRIPMSARALPLDQQRRRPHFEVALALRLVCHRTATLRAALVPGARRNV